METNTKRGRPQGQSRAEMQCVGYLTEKGLLAHLSRLVREGTIGHFWAVQHTPDEESKKVHWHLRLTPPASKAVDWQAVADGIWETVPGEDKPRRLVLGKAACNNASEEGLLYARHESRYLAAKGLIKAWKDIPRELFKTDSEEWLDAQWAAADAYEPTPRKMTIDDLIELVESEFQPSRRELLRLALKSGLNKGQWEMLVEYASECRRSK